MSLRWPLALFSLLVVPALAGAYLWQVRRKRKSAVRYSSVALIRSAMPTRSRWRRLLPMALFLGGLAVLGVGSARPQASVKVPLGRTSIILALDVSGSMCATDVAPNRLTVAQAAARAFVKNQPAGTRIGIVAFAGFAEQLVAPTTDKHSLLKAIDGLTTSRGTVIGAAELKSIDAIAAVNPDVAPVSPELAADAAGSAADGFSPTPETIPAGPAPTVPAKGYVPDIVVLLTDGANTRGIGPIEAAKQAVDRRVRIYTIGFGTTNATSMVCSPEQLGPDSGFGGFGGAGGANGANGAGGLGGIGGLPNGGFGGAGGGGGAFARFLYIDEPTLQQVAKMTGGAYYRAENAAQLTKVFAALPKQVVLQSRRVEISAVFAGLGALLAGLAMALSLLWNRSP